MYTIKEMNEMWYELLPLEEQSQKSFYGKARVRINEDASETLYSYDVKIMTKYDDGRIEKHWNHWTATTGKHIKAFSGLNKKQYIELPIE